MNIDGSNFSCLVVGSGSLPIRCSEILLTCGHRIVGIASTDSEVKKWADSNAIKCYEPGEGLAHRIEGEFDYLFSIVNQHILRDDLLRLPRKIAINYHDALLPRYAGTHATSWAILNAETHHGITWHVITDVVDAGDILKQRQITITPSDTALTLNTKCFESAAVAFEELIHELATGKIERQKQDLNQRTFFPRFKRPANAGTISWERPAAEISALVRGLNFGDHPNPLGSAKVLIEDEFFIVRNIDVLDAPSPSTEGTINGTGDGVINVSAADHEVVLRNLTDLNGEAISIPDLATRYVLRPGTKLPAIEPLRCEFLNDLYKEVCKHEAYWVDTLATFEPTQPPYLNSSAIGLAPDRRSVPLPEHVGASPPLSPEAVVTAFGAFLSRLTGSDACGIGFSYPALLKKISGFDHLFSLQIPLCLHIDHSKGLNDLLTASERQLQAAKARITYPLDITARYPQLSSFIRPAVEAVIADEPNSTSASEGSALSLIVRSDGSGTSFVYDGHLIGDEDIERLVSSFSAFLSEIAHDPVKPLSHASLLRSDELSRLIGNTDYVPKTQPGDQLIHKLFEKQADATPHAIALIHGTERLTYAELNGRANRMAHYLRDLGVGPENLVAICLDRSVEMIVGILAILKAGGAYVPLDPAYPRNRIEYILADSQAPLLITKERSASELDSGQHSVIAVDRDAQKIAQRSSENLVAGPSPHDLAYVIYTSGSTGQPKGVAIEHRSAVSLIEWANTVFTPEQIKGVLASTSVCFDLSIFEMFVPLSRGGSVILVENILHLKDSPAANEVTLINTVPSAVSELLRHNGIPASVRTVNLAGEPLKTTLVNQIYQLGTVNEVYDLYGPSEDTTYSTFTLRDSGPAHIGKPIAGTYAYILDRYMQPVPVGIPGELYLGGDGLARGYLHKPELTETRFIPDPFRPGCRVYRTGDLVRYIDKSNIEYLGRIDNQVKIRGFRIELGEIESVLSAHDSVGEAVAIVRDDRGDEKRIVAYFTTIGSVSHDELREHLKRQLPDYMIPGTFVELDELPLTPNGKIDRKSLPVPQTPSREVDASYVANRDETEARLVSIWEDILGTSPIGIRDNFFELGGHSLQAVRMFARVEEEFCKSIPLATLFEAETIEKLADILRQNTWAERESSIVPIQPNGSRPPFFCIHAKGGNVLFYRDLAQRLGNDQPFYGVQARRLGGRQVGHATVEEMAAFYIDEMKTVQPQGPYFIGGSSFGGLVAYEIAQQLTQMSESVGLLALLDTGTPTYPQMLDNMSKYKLKALDLIGRIEQHRDSLRLFNNQERKDYVIDKLKKVKLTYKRRFNNKYKKIARAAFLKIKGKGSIPTSYIQLEDQIWKAGLKYVPKPYPGEMTLFRATTQPVGIVEDRTLGWSGLPAEIEIHDVTGHHGSIVTEPYVRELAAKLEKCMDLAIAATRIVDQPRSNGHRRASSDRLHNAVAV